MAERDQNGAPGADAAPSREAEMEAALDRVRQLTARHTGLDLPPWTGHDAGALPMTTSPATMPGRTMRSMRASATPSAGGVDAKPVLPPPPPAPPRPSGEGNREPRPAPAPAPAPRGDPAPSASEARGTLMLTPDHRVPEAAAPKPGGTAAGAAEGLDDAALRTLVQSIVREELRAELRGDLGLGLTRTVRKVARQEVNHLLAAREID